jgi:hypothetical protein
VDVVTTTFGVTEVTVHGWDTAYSMVLGIDHKPHRSATVPMRAPMAWKGVTVRNRGDTINILINR